MKTSRILLVLAAALFLLAGPPGIAAETAADAGRAAGPGKEAGADRTVPVDLNRLVKLVVERNTALIADYLQKEIAKANVSAEEGIFEPVLHSYVNYGSDNYPNTTEDILVRQQEDYSEDAVSTELGVKGLFSTGGTWDLSYLDKIRTSSTIDKFREWDYEYGKSLKLTLEQPILRNAGKSATKAKINLAKIESEIEADKFRQKVMELIGATVRQYYKLYGAQEICRSWKKSLEISESFLEDFERRAMGGKLPETDLLEARCSIGLRRAELYNAENKLIEAQIQLLTLLNVTAANTAQAKLLAADVKSMEHTPITDANAYIQMAYDNWPEYLIAKKQIEKEKIRVGFTRNQKLPKLDLVGDVSLNSLDQDWNDSFQQITNGDFVSCFVGLKLELPIFGNESGKQQFMIAQMQERQASVNLSAFQTGLENAIVDRVEQVNRFNNQVDEYERVWELRSTLLDIARTKLSYGHITLTDLLDEEEDYVKYQRQLLNAIVEFKLSEAELEIAVGSILKKYGISDEDIDRIVTRGPVAPWKGADLSGLF